MILTKFVFIIYNKKVFYDIVDEIDLCVVLSAEAWSVTWHLEIRLAQNILMKHWWQDPCYVFSGLCARARATAIELSGNASG